MTGYILGLIIAFLLGVFVGVGLQGIVSMNSINDSINEAYQNGYDKGRRDEKEHIFKTIEENFLCEGDKKDEENT